jgi:hypothetical protein
MTKQEFLDGREFIFAGNNYRLNEGGLSIIRVYRTSEGELVITDNEANVGKIGTKTVSTYTFVFGKQIKQKLRFEDMELYDGGDE